MEPPQRVGVSLAAAVPEQTVPLAHTLTRLWWSLGEWLKRLVSSNASELDGEHETRSHPWHQPRWMQPVDCPPPHEADMAEGPSFRGAVPLRSESIARSSCDKRSRTGVEGLPSSASPCSSSGCAMPGFTDATGSSGRGT